MLKVLAQKQASEVAISFEIMKKVRNFFRKPLDKPSNLWYNLGVR